MRQLCRMRGVSRSPIALANSYSQMALFPGDNSRSRHGTACQPVPRWASHRVTTLCWRLNVRPVRPRACDDQQHVAATEKAAAAAGAIALVSGSASMLLASRCGGAPNRHPKLLLCSCGALKSLGSHGSSESHDTHRHRFVCLCGHAHTPAGVCLCVCAPTLVWTCSKVAGRQLS